MVKYAELPNGVRIPYVEQGDTSGLPLLLLHGFAGSWQSFEPVLPHLPESIHVFAATLRGHGDASKPPGGYRLGDWALDVAAFMDVLQLEAAVVAGHSMGSGGALRFAVDYPQKTLGLVLAGACVPRAGDARVRAFWESTVSELSDPMDPAFVREFLESTLAQPVPPATFERMLQDSLKVPARVWQAAWKNRLDQDPSVDLDKVRVPTLLVWGDQDARCPRSDQEALAGGIADSQLVVYAGAGHSLHAEEPERFAADLVAFVEEVVDSVHKM